MRDSAAGAEVVIFEGGLDAEETIRLFSRADAVVGVHGGALANFIWTSPGCLLVELGFPRSGEELTEANPYLLHFQHLASALGNPYAFQPLSGDAKGRGPGAHEVALPAASLDAVKSSIARHLETKRDEL